MADVSENALYARLAGILDRIDDAVSEIRTEIERVAVATSTTKERESDDGND